VGCDVCYTNHAEADQNDMDALLTLLAVAGVTYIMGVPGSDDIMLNYQTTSFHDALYARRVLGLLPAPEFEAWLQKLGVFERGEALRLSEALPRPFQRALSFFAGRRDDGQAETPDRRESLADLAPVHAGANCTGARGDQPANRPASGIPARARPRARRRASSPRDRAAADGARAARPRGHRVAQRCGRPPDLPPAPRPGPASGPRLAPPAGGAREPLQGRIRRGLRRRRRPFRSPRRGQPRTRPRLGVREARTRGIAHRARPDRRAGPGARGRRGRSATEGGAGSDTDRRSPV